MHIKNGYKYLKKPNHPNANKAGFIAEHRLKISQQLKRALTKEEKVKHINGNKLDNRIENLKVMQQSHKKIVLRKNVCHCNKPWSTRTYRGYEIKWDYVKIFRFIREKRF